MSVQFTSKEIDQAYDFLKDINGKTYITTQAAIKHIKTKWLACHPDKLRCLEQEIADLETTTLKTNIYTQNKLKKLKAEKEAKNRLSEKLSLAKAYFESLDPSRSRDAVWIKIPQKRSFTTPPTRKPTYTPSKYFGIFDILNAMFRIITLFIIIILKSIKF